MHAELARRIEQESVLPRPAEQADTILSWLGSNLRENFGGTVKLRLLDAAGRSGSVSVEGVHYVLEYLKSKGLISDEYHYQYIGDDRILGLTFKGWERYEAIQRKSAGPRIAFMAMPFKNATLDEVYSKHFKPTVHETGFQLERLDENQPAGSIDNHLRLKIRASRFVIAELSEGNQGVYFEAGLAEGIGIPVFYTCEATSYEKNPRIVHFDTRQSKIVFWKNETIGSDMQSLKDTIRVTVLADARLTDERLDSQVG